LQDVPVVMGSPRIGPPPRPVTPVAAAVRAAPPARDAASAGAKRAIWVKAVQLAAIRSGPYRHPARLRYLVLFHPGEPAIAISRRLRRLVVLRLAHHHAGHD
jgi:hypothetical protein